MVGGRDSAVHTGSPDTIHALSSIVAPETIVLGEKMALSTAQGSTSLSRVGSGGGRRQGAEGGGNQILSIRRPRLFSDWGFGALGQLNGKASLEWTLGFLE